MDVCTVIAKNYAAHARVLARSFAAHHPEDHFYVLVIDEPAGYLSPDEEPFTILSASDVGVERFETMSALYNVLELATAVKPWLLRWVAAHSEDNAAVYLDPDMRIYAPLHDVFARVHEHELVSRLTTSAQCLAMAGAQASRTSSSPAHTTSASSA